MKSLLFLLSTAVLCSGCGGSDRPDLTEAVGTVKLDGQPVAEAIIAFKPIVDANSEYKRPSRATTDASGQFKVSTYGAGDGMPIGKYKVGVVKRELVGDPPEGMTAENESNFNLKYQWTVPRKYASPESSGLEVEVTEEGLVPPVLELKSDGQKPEIEFTGPRSRANEP